MPGKTTTMDELVERVRKHDPRKVWSTVKTKMLAELKKGDYKQEAKALEKKFNEGLGPALDKWTAELKKYPKWDIAKMLSIRHDITGIMKSYIKAINEAGLSGRDSIGLKGVLEILDKALAENWKVLDATGRK